MMREPDRALAITRARTTARLIDETSTSAETRRVLEAIVTRDLPRYPTSTDIARFLAERRAARAALEIT